MKKALGVFLAIVLLLNLCPEISVRAAEEEGFIVSFTGTEGINYVAYDRQNIEEAVATEDAAYAIARDSDTGEIDVTGNGQVNFSVVIEEGYAFDGIEITEGTGNYKNLKSISEEGNVFTYRITKIKGNLTVSAKAVKLDTEGEREILVAELKEAMSSYPKYYQTYCTAETAAALKSALSFAKNINLENALNEEIEKATANILAAVSGLKYKTAEVPQIYISTEDGKGNSLSKSKGYVNTDVVITDTDGSFIAGSGEIKVRGNSTAGAEKKPYNIKFSSKQNVLGMGNAKKWCLLANCYDPSLIRNSIAFKVAQEFGLPYTSENSFVEVWMDGVFKGCYLLTEAVEAGETRVDIKVKNGEFMLELEKSRVEEGTTYITNANGIRFSFKEPEEPTEAQYTHVKEILDTITEIIDSGDYAEVEKAIDVESFAKFLVLNEYMRNNDFNWSSTYFFYKGGKLYAGPAWDFDLSSGNGNPNYPDNLRYDKATARYANWYPYLLKYGEFQKLVVGYIEEYKDFLSDISAEGGYIDTLIESYNNVFNRNFNEAGWVISKRYSQNEMIPFDTYEENVEFLTNWLTNRVDWMDTYYHTSLIPRVWIQSAAVEEDHVTITWKEEDVEGYRVYRREADSWVPLTGVISGNSYNDYKVEEGKEYFYDVVAVVNGLRGSNDVVGNSVFVSSMTTTNLLIEKNPEDIELFSTNVKVTFSVEAFGKELKYMWYYRNPGSESYIKSNVAESQYSRYIKDSNIGMEVYCVITDIYGRTIKSDIATVRKVEDTTPIEIIKDTEDIAPRKVGKRVTFTIEATGKDLKYSWYYKRPGEDVFYKAGVYTNEYSRCYTESLDGMQVYCLITDAAGKQVKGRVATLARIVSKIDIITDTTDVVAKKIGEKCTFRIEAEGSKLTYFWYYKRPGDTVFYKAGAYTNEYSRYYTENIDGMQAYCEITDEYGNSVVGRIATLYMKKNTEIEITYPLGTELVVAKGKKINFTVEVNTSEDISYKWYYMIPVSQGGDGVFHSTGCYSNVYTRTATQGINGMQAYCVVTDPDGNRTTSEIFTFVLK